MGLTFTIFLKIINMHIPCIVFYYVHDKRINISYIWIHVSSLYIIVY